MKESMAVFLADKESLGMRLRRLRVASDLSQCELASLTGVSPRALCSYEKDQREPPAHNLPVLARHLGVTVDELLGLRPVETRPPLRVSRRWLQKFELIDQLTERKQRAIMQVLDMALKTT
jgi:transcriptional regulator with XRE-family HTH domain